MKNIFSFSVLVALLISLGGGTALARECTDCKKKATNVTQLQPKAAVCKRAQSTAELNVNNVRALINGYGNMWYDGSVAQYHLPKSGNACPLYCSALWIGGTDVNEQLRIAALRFGQEGDDYWPGPLELNSAYVDLEVCNQYDKHFVITKNDVMTLMAQFEYTENGATLVGDMDLVPDVVKNWPAHGEGNQSHYLAPFYDANGDGEYDCNDGDYPYYDFNNELCPKTWKSEHPGAGLFTAPTMETEAGIVKGGILSDQVLKGDQTIWWVFNDMGNIHTESDGQPIGLEIRAQAFAFSTNDEINNMTFYSYEIINRSTYTLKDTYFSQWVDPDLGYAYDDYVGCDVKRGLGYCYNGDEQDGPGSGSYSGIPPAVGIDFFQGPYMDPDGKDNPKLDIEKLKANDRYNAMLPNYLKRDENGIYVGDNAQGYPVYDTFALTQDADLFFPDGWYFKPGDSIGNCAINGVNFGNGIVDDERFGMRRFVYYNNSSSGDNSEPAKATDYYNYLKGKWKNGRRMWFGGDGLRQGTIDNLECDFMFPGDSDPWNWGTNGVEPNLGHDWTEANEGNQPNDRRFMQSAGPFTLKPGALNYITVGIPFAQAPSGSAWSSVELLREIDDVCQSLFENCFKVLDGPDAPTLVAQELNNEIVLYVTYDNPKSNNYNECYRELDASIARSYVGKTATGADTIMLYSDEERSYKFEGYQIYQLVDSKASVADIGDVTKARLVAQCDVENYYDDAKTLPIANLVNFETNSATGLLTGKIMVNGANKGIQHVFRVTTDQFAAGTNNKLVNNKEYYFIAIAYAQNRYKEYSQTVAAYLDGQKEPYLAGRKDEFGNSITPVVAVPHDPISENGGTIAQSEFGMRPNITRMEGYGNGGYELRLSEDDITRLMGAKGEAGMAPGSFTYDASNGGFKNVSNPCLIANPSYQVNYGPVDVQVIDPLSVKPGKFVINFVPAEGAGSITDSARWFITNANGGPVYGDKDTVYSDFIIGRYNEQLFLDLGISVALSNPVAVASTLTYDPDGIENEFMYYQGFVNPNTVISATQTFEDPYNMWLSAINDYDAAQAYNWIRSGMQYTIGSAGSFVNSTSPISMSEAYLDEDYYRVSRVVGDLGNPISAGVDKNAVFEDVIGGTWAPYGVVSNLDFHPGFNYSYFMPHRDTLAKVYTRSDGKRQYDYNGLKRNLMDNRYNRSLIFNDLSNLPSVRIVFTADTSKWTRCPVLEMCDDFTQSEGNARKFQKRAHLSVDKLGRTIEDRGIAANPNDPSNPAYIDAYGMGWFPGYAISLATGERLNIMFGEDSRYVQYNGRDMLWNPVSTITTGTENYVMGGRHFIYVMNATTVNYPNFLNNPAASLTGLTGYATPSYDAGAWANKMLRSTDRLLAYAEPTTNRTPYFYRGLVCPEWQNCKTLADEALRDSISLLFASTAWVNMPLVNEGFEFKYPGHNSQLNAGYAMDGIPTDVTIDINVNMPYGRFMGHNGTKANQCGASDNNKNYPRYQFEFDENMAVLTNQAENFNKTSGMYDSKEDYRKAILENINVVPNPYYSYSDYETLSQLETKVRIINVPANSVVSIYTVDGTMVRKLGPTSGASSTLDWDLHNHNGIPIAGGIYLIHVEVPGVGDRVIKWFGTMRPVDLNSFQF